MGLLSRLWTGIVAAVAGIALAVLAQVVGQTTVGLPIEYLEKIAISLGVAGFVIGFAVRNRGSGTPKDKTHQDEFSQ
jgi:hypothetical protein